MFQSLEHRVNGTNSLGMTHQFGNSAKAYSPTDPQAVPGTYQGLQHPIHCNDTLNGLERRVGQGTQAPVQKASHLSLLDIRSYDKPEGNTNTGDAQQDSNVENPPTFHQTHFLPAPKQSCCLHTWPSLQESKALTIMVEQLISHEVIHRPLHLPSFPPGAQIIQQLHKSTDTFIPTTAREHLPTSQLQLLLRVSLNLRIHPQQPSPIGNPNPRTSLPQSLWIIQLPPHDAGPVSFHPKSS